MRCLVSSTCLLFQIIAMLAVFVTVSEALMCHHLKETGDIFVQMSTCKDNVFEVPSSPDYVFDLSNLTQAEADAILFEKNDNEKKSPKSFRGHVRIVGSPLKSLSLRLADLGRSQTLEIIRNTELHELKLSLTTADPTNMTLTLKGNRKLSRMNIMNIDCLFSSKPTVSLKLQVAHECLFENGEVKNISELEGCANIEGDLIINSQTVIPDPMPYISQIDTIRSGCVKIENSNLTSLDFLTNIRKKQGQCTAGQHVIKNNTKLCLTSEEQEKWKTAGFELTYAGQCLDRCTAKFAKDNRNKTKAPCDVVVGDVKIIGRSVTQTELAHWDRVKVLKGTLEVDGTNLENIAIFKNLEKIVNPSPEKIALVVIKNQNMTKFDLPKLKNITMPPGAMSQPIFFQKNNPKFEFSSDESKKWNRITGQKKLLIPVKLEEKKEETNNNKNTKKYWIMGLAGTFSTLISLGMVGGAVFYAKRDFKKVEKIAKRRRAAKKRRSRKIGNRKTGSRTIGSKTTGRGKTGRKRRRSRIRRKRKCTTKSRTGKKIKL